MKAIVQMEVTIPDGYELAEPLVRPAKKGDLYLYDRHARECESGTAYNCVILKKKWEPEVDKYYLFFHSGYRNLSQVRRFDRMRGEMYTDNQGAEWSNCEPLPKEMIGE